MRTSSTVPTVAVVYDWRNNARKDQRAQYPVDIRVTLARKVKYISTGVKVCPDEWRGQVVRRVDAPLLNERISMLRRNVEKIVNAQLESGSISLDAICLQTQSSKPDSFLDFCEQRSDARNVAPRTRQRYHTFLENIRRYGRIRTFADLTTEAVVKYDEWLHGLTLPYNGLPLAQATVWNYHKVFRMMCADALLFRHIEENPYARLPRGYISKGEREEVQFLTSDEIDALEHVELPIPSLCRARDLFLWQIYTGQSYVDTQTFCWEDYRLVDGVYVCTRPRAKTGVHYMTVLSPKALQIVERYGHNLPRLENATYNRFLKVVGMYAGITRNLHSHLGRYTFATQMLARGAAITNVSKMLGHTNVRQTQRYAQTLEESVLADCRRIMQ